MNSSENLLSVYPGELYYFNSVIEPERAVNLLNLFIATISWKTESIRMYGKLVQEPRLTAWYGLPEASYTYSGKTNRPLPFTKELLDLKIIAEQYCQQDFNSVLLNYYRNGLDSMGWHRDNEKELGANACIASFSFGVARDFIVRPYKQLRPRVSLSLSSGSLVIMKGQMQQYWEHALPKRTRVQGPRVNLTFRKIV